MYLIKNVSNKNNILSSKLSILSNKLSILSKKLIISSNKLSILSDKLSIILTANEISHLTKLCRSFLRECGASCWAGTGESVQKRERRIGKEVAEGGE